MKKRNPAAVAALTLITFGLYAYYWLFQTTDELRRETARKDLSPVLDVMLAIITVGLWGIWAGYRNAKITHELLESRGETHSDRSAPVAIFAAVGAFSGWAWPVAIAILQQDYNRVVEFEEAQSHFDAAVPYEEATAHHSPRVEPAPFVSASRGPRVRVVVAEPEPMPEGVPVSKWSSAPSAPVFVSNAPMPIVY